MICPTILLCLYIPFSLKTVRNRWRFHSDRTKCLVPLLSSPSPTEPLWPLGFCIAPSPTTTSRLLFLRVVFEDAMQALVTRSRSWPLKCSSFTKFVRHLGGFSALAPKKLASILNLETLTHATPEEVSSTWEKEHSGRGLITAIINKNQFNTLQHRSRICSLFVIPVRRGNGYTSFFLQAQMPHILFTSLEDYKVRGTNASPYLTVAHYTELMDSKGLILVRGDIVFPSKLSDFEAKQLLEISHSFFLNDSRYRLVEQFNKHSSDFEFNDVLKELDLPTGP